MDYDDDIDINTMCDDCGNEYMLVEDHEEAMQDFKNIGSSILKELLIAIKRMDTVALNDAIDEMAEHLGTTI